MTTTIRSNLCRAASAPAVTPPADPGSAASLPIRARLGTRQPGEQCGRSRERRGVQGEGGDRRQREKRATGGRPEKRAADHLHDVLGAVRPGKQVLRDKRRQHRLGRVVEDHLRAAEAEPGADERPDVDVVDRDKDGDRGDRGALDKLSLPHQPHPVAPVNERAGWQRDHQPRQRGRHRDGRDEPRIPGERDREQRQRRGERPVARAVDGVGPPQPPVGRAEAGFLLNLCRHTRERPLPARLAATIKPVP